MSYGIAVKNKDGLDLGNSNAPHLGGGQNWFIVDDEPVIVFGDEVTPHAPPFIPHIAPVMNVEGSSWMTIDGIKVIREGHKGNCMHVSTGRDWFLIAD